MLVFFWTQNLDDWINILRLELSDVYATIKVNVLTLVKLLRGQSEHPAVWFPTGSVNPLILLTLKGSVNTRSLITSNKTVHLHLFWLGLSHPWWTACQAKESVLPNAFIKL